MYLSKKFEQKNIIEQLEKIGIKGTDAKVYIASLNLGAASIKQLTEYLQINRITLHDAVTRLINRGLLLETYSNKKRLIFPEQISKLTHLVDIKKAELDHLSHDINTTIGILESLHLQSKYLPKIRIMKGQEGIQQMLLEIKNEKTDLVKVITDSWHFDGLLHVKFLDTLSSKKHKPQIQILLPAGFEHFIFSGKAKGLNIHSKILNGGIGWKGGMTIWENKVALHAYEGIYITTTIIENQAIVEMMKVCFHGLWEM